jgi:hypothetical protein
MYIHLSKYGRAMSTPLFKHKMARSQTAYHSMQYIMRVLSCGILAQYHIWYVGYLPVGRERRSYTYLPCSEWSHLSNIAMYSAWTYLY